MSVGERARETNVQNGCSRGHSARYGGKAERVERKAVRLTDAREPRSWIGTVAAACC